MEKFLKRIKEYNGKILDLNVDEVLLEDGTKSLREKVINTGGAAIIAVTDEKKVVFVKQFRYGQMADMIEIPAGKLAAGEDPAAAAKRELKEETGYVAGSVRKLVSFAPTPAYVSEIIHVFLATDLVKEEACLDEGEFVEAFELDIETALQYIEDGIIFDGKTIVALLMVDKMIKDGTV